MFGAWSWKWVFGVFGTFNIFTSWFSLSTLDISGNSRNRDSSMSIVISRFAGCVGFMIGSLSPAKTSDLLNSSPLNGLSCSFGFPCRGTDVCFMGEFLISSLSSFSALSSESVDICYDQVICVNWGDVTASSDSLFGNLKLMCGVLGFITRGFSTLFFVTLLG